MDKKVENEAVDIEGSAARAADRGRQEDLGWPEGDKPSLGDAGVVRGLLQDFATAVIGARADYNADKATGGEAAARVKAEAQKYGDIFMGRDTADFQPLEWNSPDRLGNHIAAVMPVEDGADPGVALFLALGASLVELAKAHEDSHVSDPAAKATLTGQLDDVASVLLGLPR